MATSKEPQVTRVPSQHRLSTSNIAAPSLTVPSRHATSRQHSHSVSLGTFNPTHRVTRRKSMTSTAANQLAAMAAAIKGIDEATLGASAPSNRRSLTVKHGSTRPINGGEGKYLMDSYQSSNKDVEDEDNTANIESPILDNHASAEGDTKTRARRASEGAHAAKHEGKRASGELRCEKCGKGYKHSSCLTKHLWEHTPEWSYTSKLLISKHQQVQLLEAASVLVAMNQDPSIGSESAKAGDSDNSSASPAASGFSELQDDDISSVETTPPPMSEDTSAPGSSHMRDSKRYSNTSSVFSRSYQSAPSGSVAASSVPTTTSFGSFHQSAYQRRPSTSGSGAAYGLGPAEDEAGLAAAVELCNFGTPRTGPVHLPLDVPPVPPLPARYASLNANRSLGGSGSTILQHEFALHPPLTHRLSDERDVKMHEGYKSHVEDDDEYFDQRSVSRGRSDEDDDGVFGRMEE